MKAHRALRTLTALSSKLHPNAHLNLTLPRRRFYASHPQPDNLDDDSVFDSSHYALPAAASAGPASPPQPAWDEAYREKANRTIFGEEKLTPGTKVEEEESKRHRAAVLAKALLEAALERPDQEDDDEESSTVKEEDQLSLSVGIVGPPNAGKSSLTNYLVGTKVAAVSRKTNTTSHEVLGVMTQGNTQICFFDTPGLMLRKSGYPHSDMKFRVQSAWSSVALYDALVVMFDANRHLNRPDKRVVRLIEKMGAQKHPTQKRLLCFNKIDLIEKKKDLLKIAEEFKELPGYDRCFMISGLKGAGIADLTQYLMEQAVKRPWDENPDTMTEEVMKHTSLEVVRERLLDHIHQEIPYNIEHRLIGWSELRDGSLRIEQHLITHKESQKKILVGKGGSKIGRIGMEANEELSSIFGRDVRLILVVKLK